MTRNQCHDTIGRSLLRRLVPLLSELTASELRRDTSLNLFYESTGWSSYPLGQIPRHGDA